MTGFSVNQIRDDDPRAAVIAGMVSDLGWCLNSYGQIEFLIADLVWQGWRLPEYQHLEIPLPQSLDNRVKQLERIFDSPGPYAFYAADIRLLIGRLKELSEPRNMFAHGHCTFVYTRDGDAGMMFRRFLPPTKGGKTERYEALVRPESLAHARVVWTRFASSAQRVISRVYLELELEKV